MNRLVSVITLLIALLTPTSAYALSGSLGGDTGSSGGGGGGGGTSGVASHRFVPDKDSMRKWVFGSSSTAPSASNCGDYYDVDSFSGAMSPATVRGGRGILDHWNIYIISPIFDDPEGNGADDNTSKSINSATQIEAWEPPPAAAYIGEAWNDWWHDHYWGGNSSTNGTPRPAKTDYGVEDKTYAEKNTYSASDPHIHQWFSSSKNESHKIRGDEWKHSLKNETTLSGGRLITVTGNNGGVDYPNDDPRDGSPEITVDSGAMAMDLNRPEGRYSLFMFGIGGRGEVVNRTASHEVIRRPRVRVVAYRDLNANDTYDKGEEIDVRWSLTLPKGSLHDAAITSPMVDGDMTLGQDADGDARLESGEAVGRDVLYPAPIASSKAGSTPEKTTLVDGSTASVIRQRIIQRGYTLDIETPYYSVQSASVTRDYWVGGARKTEAVNPLGALQVLDYSGSKYRFAGASKSSTNYYVNSTGQNIYAGIPFGYRAGGYDGGTYTVYVNAIAMSSPVHGKVYYDKNQNKQRDDGEPLIPDDAVNTMTLDESKSFAVGSRFSLVSLSAGTHNLKMSLGRTTIPWVLTTPASQTALVTNSQVPVEVLWGAYANLSPTPKPAVESHEMEWLDTGRPLTLKFNPPFVVRAIDKWTPVRTYLLQPLSKTYWDWRYYNPTLARMKYKSLSGLGSISSEPQSWIAANADYGIPAASRVWWAGTKAYATPASALLQRPEYRYSDNKTRVDGGSINQSFVPVGIVGQDLEGGVNYYQTVLWQHDLTTFDVVESDGDSVMIPSVQTTYEWGFGARNVKVWTAKPRY